MYMIFMVHGEIYPDVYCGKEQRNDVPVELKSIDSIKIFKVQPTLFNGWLSISSKVCLLYGYRWLIDFNP